MTFFSTFFLIWGVSSWCFFSHFFYHFFLFLGCTHWIFINRWEGRVLVLVDGFSGIFQRCGNSLSPLPRHQCRTMPTHLCFPTISKTSLPNILYTVQTVESCIIISSLKLTSIYMQYKSKCLLYLTLWR